MAVTAPTRTARTIQSCVFSLLFCCIAGGCAHGAKTLPRVQVKGNRFVLADSGRAFTAWGQNYSHLDQLLEDFWVEHWPEVERDFREMKRLGVNVVRVHLQVGKFMDSPERMNPLALRQLRRLLALAEREGMYLDVTGLAAYRPADVPAWYEAPDEEAHWAAQEFFWESIAQTCANSDAVFCYDLINEPLAPAGKREQWASGKLFGGFDFLQYIGLDQKGKPREQLAVEWIRRMRGAIRRHDRRHLVTVGLLPWVKGWGHLSGFLPEAVAPELDFVSVHIYPVQGKADEAVEVLKKFAVGKPVVVEETFPLSCDVETLRQFMEHGRPIAGGWVGHYFGQSLDELDALKRRGTITAGQDVTRQWLMLFRDMSRGEAHRSSN
jgi:hypothetical protein